MSITTELTDALAWRKRQCSALADKDCKASVYMNPKAYRDLLNDPAALMYMNSPMYDQIMGCPVYAVDNMNHPRWVIHTEE